MDPIPSTSAQAEPSISSTSISLSDPHATSAPTAPLVRAATPIPTGLPTVQNRIQDLQLQNHAACKGQLDATHLHPYAPSSSNPSHLFGSSNGKRKRAAENGTGPGNVLGAGDDGVGVSHRDNAGAGAGLSGLRESIVHLRGILNHHLAVHGSASSNIGAGVTAGSQVAGDVGRLVRALKEISTHQTALLSSTSTLHQSPSSYPQNGTLPNLNPAWQIRPTLFSSSLILLPPVSLFQTLATSIGLQCFIEDSQFGLLKSSIAIAGEKVVLDVDLEIDTLVGEEEGEGEDEDVPMSAAASSIANNAGSSANGNGGKEGERNKVKLSKLIANHVTSSGGTGKSTHLTDVLRRNIEEYLDLWNGSDAGVDAIAGAGAEVWAKEKCLGRLRRSLEELKELDEIAEIQTKRSITSEMGETTQLKDQEQDEKQSDWFDVLEKGVQLMDEMRRNDKIGVKIYPTSRNSVFPTFHLLPSSSSSSTSAAEDQGKSNDHYNPTFRLRPSRPLEHVTTPYSASGPTAGAEAAANTLNVDADVGMDDSWTEGDWVLEVVPDEHSNSADGLVVRRSWLRGGDTESGVHLNSAGGTGHGSSIDPSVSLSNSSGSSVKVENLLYRPLPDDNFIPAGNRMGGANQPQAFPYTASFIHADPDPSQQPYAPEVDQADSGAQRRQQWSIAQPGPPGFVVAKMGVPRSLAGLERLLKALRSQVVLNSLFDSVFDARYLDPMVDRDDAQDDDDDDEDDDLLDGPQKTIPITVSMHETSLDLSFPLIESIKMGGGVNNVQLTLRYDDDVESYVRVSAVEGNEGGGADLDLGLGLIGAKSGKAGKEESFEGHRDLARFVRKIVAEHNSSSDPKGRSG